MKILSPSYSLKLKNIILLLNQGLIFFQIVIFATLCRRCPILWKSTLKMTTLFRRCLTLFNSTLNYTTLLNVVNFNVDLHNVASTLIWRCATSRRHINLKTTLSRCWNVCWDVFHINPFVLNAHFLYLPENIRNPYSFLMFSGGREREHWEKMGKTNLFYIAIQGHI